MAMFTVRSRQDAFVDSTALVEADNAQAAANLAYDGGAGICWERRGVVEFDARLIITLDADGAEIESTARGKF